MNAHEYYTHVQLQVKYLESYNLKEWGELKYNKAGDAGFDLRYAGSTHVTLNKGDIRVVPCGIKIGVPDGYQIEVRPRSGLASKGITIVNSPGTCDAGFLGEYMIILHYLYNTRLEKSITFNPGDRIAQAVLMPVQRATFLTVDSLEATERGEGGFGSTGLK